MPKNKPWTIEEIQPVVTSYFSMLTMVLTGKEFRKADIVAELAKQIPDRTRKSIEYKLQNASAVLVEQQLPYIPGYAPKAHYQEELRRFLLTQRETLNKIVSLSEFYSNEFKPPKGVLRSFLSRPEDVVIDAPSKRKISIQHRTPSASKHDYYAGEAMSRNIGLFGEKFCLRYEKSRLRTIGRPELADQVEHTAVERGDGLGYDIKSFEKDGSERYIEVKTTLLDQYAPFIVTANELRVSEELSQRYFVYRVFNCSKQPQLFQTRGSFGSCYTIEPAIYRAFR